MLYDGVMILAAILSVLTVSPSPVQPSPHPAFQINPDAMQKAYDAGREAAKKKVKPWTYARPWSKDIGKVRSPPGQSWTAPYAILMTPTVFAGGMGLEDGRLYEDDTKFKGIIKSAKENPPQPKDRRIRLIVMLYAWPGISDWDGSLNRSAKEADVRDVKFVLLIDGEKPLHPLVKPSPTATETSDGTVAIPEAHTIYGSSTSGATGTYSGTGGFGTAAGTGWATSTVTYYTSRIENYSTYFASYALEFPMYDDSGKCLVPPSTKTLVLKVIRPDGEHTGVFKLDDFIPK